MSEMQNEIACKALDLLALLLARDDGGRSSDAKEGGDSKRSERQTLVADVEDGVLSEMLAHVAFSRAEAFSHAPAECRERAMRVAGALVDVHPTNQYNLGEASLLSDEKQPTGAGVKREGIIFRSGPTRRPRECEMPGQWCSDTITFLLSTKIGSARTVWCVYVCRRPADRLHRFPAQGRLECCERFDVFRVPTWSCRRRPLPAQLLIQDVGLDSVALATLVMEGALGKGGADPSITETFHWWVFDDCSY